MLRTDSDGIGTIPLPDGAVCEVFVIPADGSLATATVRANDENENIVVPPGDAILRIRIEDETGTPVPGVTLLLRANGYFVPLEVMNRIAPGAPFSLRTDARVTLVSTGYRSVCTIFGRCLTRRVLVTLRCRLRRRLRKSQRRRGLTTSRWSLNAM